MTPDLLLTGHPSAGIYSGICRLNSGASLISAAFETSPKHF
jgi:hypothetical protein